MQLQTILEKFQFDLRMQRDGWIVQNAVAKKKTIPKWYVNRIELTEQEQGIYQTYIHYWNSLSSERKYELGSIPWHFIKQHGEMLKLTDHGLIDHINIIQAIDKVYIEWQLKLKRDEERRLEKNKA